MFIEFERARKDVPMSTKRNSYTPEQKLKIVLEVIRGDQTLAQIASKYRLHSPQIIRWKKQLLTCDVVSQNWKNNRVVKMNLRKILDTTLFSPSPVNVNETGVHTPANFDLR